MTKQEIIEKLTDAGGQLTVLTGIGMNIWNWVCEKDINYWVVLATSISGLIYLIYGIAIRRNKNKLLKMEIKEKENGKK